MVEFDLRIHPKQGTAYFRKEIRENFGYNLKLLPNAEGAAIYRTDADPKRVIQSLKILILDLELRAKKEK